jgi:hypothetical protein
MICTIINVDLAFITGKPGNTTVAGETVHSVCALTSIKAGVTSAIVNVVLAVIAVITRSAVNAFTISGLARHRAPVSTIENAVVCGGAHLSLICLVFRAVFL